MRQRVDQLRKRPVGDVIGVLAVMHTRERNREVDAARIGKCQ